MPKAQSIHVVIRSCGERTLELSRALVQRQLPKGASLSIVRGTPFDITLRRCYEEAIEQRRTWTVTVDADVLLAPQAITTLVRRAAAMPNHFLQLEARAFDKIQGRWREVGHRIYRTDLLPKVLATLPECGASMRPESLTIRRVGEQGHPSRLVDDTIGLHDYEQFYRDLYRKAFTHAFKHRSRAGAMIARAATLRHSDADFLVILKGIWDGLLAETELPLDADAFYRRADTALAELRIEEKAELAIDAQGDLGNWDTKFALFVARYPPPLEAPTDAPPLRLGRLAKFVRGYRYRLRSRGPVVGSIAQLGAMLRAVADKLEG